MQRASDYCCQYTRLWLAHACTPRMQSLHLQAFRSACSALVTCHLRGSAAWRNICRSIDLSSHTASLPTPCSLGAPSCRTLNRLSKHASYHLAHVNAGHVLLRVRKWACGLLLSAWCVTAPQSAHHAVHAMHCRQASRHNEHRSTETNAHQQHGERQLLLLGSDWCAAADRAA